MNAVCTCTQQIAQSVNRSIGQLVKWSIKYMASNKVMIYLGSGEFAHQVPVDYSIAGLILRINSLANDQQPCLTSSFGTIGQQAWIQFRQEQYRAFLQQIANRYREHQDERQRHKKIPLNNYLYNQFDSEIHKPSTHPTIQWSFDHSTIPDLESGFDQLFNGGFRGLILSTQEADKDHESVELTE